MEMKRCKQCGILKDAEDFRKYSYSKEKGTEGRFRICRPCERMNSRYRALSQMSPEAMSEAQQTELMKIENAYAILESKGYSTPKTAKAMDKKEEHTEADEILAFYADSVVKTPTAPEILQKQAAVPESDYSNLPDELSYWLTSSFDEWRDFPPEYLQETVYESLKAKYRPQIGVDRQTYLPIYDDTYKKPLNDILRRFDDYEDMYALEMEDENG